MKKDKSNQLVRMGNVICKMAEWLAPHASKKCMGMYYQPRKPENIGDFVSQCEKKNNCL